MEQIEIGENNFKDKSTDIQEIVKSFELRLSGHITSYSSNGYVYTGEVLCGERVIQKLVGLLDSFAKRGNLITSKENLTFYKQRFLNSEVANGILLTEEGSIAKNYIPVLTMFRTALQNIGDIILKSKDIIHDSMGRVEQEKGGLSI